MPPLKIQITPKPITYQNTTRERLYINNTSSITYHCNNTKKNHKHFFFILEKKKQKKPFQFHSHLLFHLSYSPNRPTVRCTRDEPIIQFNNVNSIYI